MSNDRQVCQAVCDAWTDYAAFHWSSHPEYTRLQDAIRDLAASLDKAAREQATP